MGRHPRLLSSSGQVSKQVVHGSYREKEYGRLKCQESRVT